MDRIIPYSDMQHGNVLHKQWCLCDFGNGYLYWYDNRSQREYGPVHGRDKVKRILDQFFTPDLVLITVNGNTSILDSVGASNFEFVKKEGRERELIYVREDGNRLPIHNWSDVLKGGGAYMYDHRPHQSQDWINLICDMVELDDLLRALRVPFDGAFGRLAVNAMRATVLERYRFVSPGFSARAYRAGRIEEKGALASTYEAIRWDIVGAYAWAMSHKPMPTAFAEDHRVNHALEGEGIALAHVEPRKINLDYQYSPVPTGYRSNMRTRWGTESVFAFFPFPDVRLARDYGAKVEIMRSWSATEYLTEQDTERLALTLIGLRTHYVGKKIANSLWGAMVARGESTIGRYLSDNDKRKTRKVRGRPKKRSLHLTSSYAAGGHISGLVREKLYREGLSSNPTILCHTDGMVILDRRHNLRRLGIPIRDYSYRPTGRLGPRLGDWKFDGRLSYLRVATAQHYVYVDAEGKRQFVWAGSDPPLADSHGAIDKLRSSGRISSYEVLRAATRHRVENWYDRWIFAEGES